VAEINLVRMTDGKIPSSDIDIVRKVLTEHIAGMGQDDIKAWNRFLTQLLKKSERGEMFQIKTWFSRNSKFHRKHMAIEQAVFHAQERFESFEQFRNWIKVGAGFCDWVPGPKGAVIPIPKSISYTKLDDANFAQLHADLMAFFRSATAVKVLWKHLSELKRFEMIEAILGEFNE
jgi:Protein of unknown function (DUF1367)